MLRFLWALAPLAWFVLPGYALLPAKLNRVLRLPFVLGASFLVTSALGMVLLFPGQFNAGGLTLLLGCLFLSVALSRRKRPSVPLGPYRVPLLLMLLAAPLFFWRGEPFQGACDAGVYVASAYHLNATGDYAIHEDWGETVPPLALRETPYQYPWMESWPGIVRVPRGLGGSDPGRFAPQFFPLYPLWLALFTAAFGVPGIPLANFAFLFCGMVFLGSVVRLLLLPRFRPLPVLCFALNPGVLYFLRYPSAEIFLFAVLMGFLSAYLIGIRFRAANGLAAAAAFAAAAFLTKYMAYFLLAPLAVHWAVSQERGTLFRRFFLPLAGFSVMPLFSIVLHNYPHFLNHFGVPERLRLAAALLGMTLLLGPLSRLRAAIRWARPALLALVLVLSFAYLVVLPQAEERGEENVLREVAWYAGWPGLLLGLGGFAVGLFTPRAALRVPLLFFLLFFLVSLAGTGDNPLHPFAFRRFVPLFLPLLGVLSALVLEWGRRLGRTATAVAAAAVLLPPVAMNLPLIGAREGRGFLALYGQIAGASVGGGGVVLDDAQWMGAQLDLVARRDWRPFHIENAGHLEQVQRLALDGSTLRILTSESLPFPRLARWSGAIERLRPERNRRPSVIETEPVCLYLYEFPLAAVRAGERIEVGGDDFGRVAGFWGPEMDGDRPYRWTRPWSHFILHARERLVLTMSASGHAENPVPFRIYIGGALAGEGFAASGWGEYAFDLPAGCRHRMVACSLVSHTFQPLPDTRDLGLMISSVGTN
jgi:hypothetical protein